MDSRDAAAHRLLIEFAALRAASRAAALPINYIVGRRASSIHYGIGLRNARFMERTRGSSPASGRNYRDGPSRAKRASSPDENVKRKTTRTFVRSLNDDCTRGM